MWLVWGLHREALYLPQGLLVYPPRILAVLVAVRNYYDISITDIVGPRRYRRVAEARRVAAYVMSRRLEMSTVEIGRVLHRDHSTVVVMLQKMKDCVVAGNHEGGVAVKLCVERADESHSRWK